MDTYSSGEDLLIKTRKPYTITKQRERWTDEEHNRFLEALKLYGRAWQRIEEHIGTKTAVQIRSHAQKFFSKLEKEALVKGVPIGQAIDIDIPPPRPKRKPSNPYPRKTGLGTPTSQVSPKDGKLLTSGSFHCNQVLDLEKEPLPEKCIQDDKASNAKENQDKCSEVLTLVQEANCSSGSTPNKSSVLTPVALGNSCRFREFVPSLEEIIDQDETNESFVTTDFKGNQKLDKPADEQTVDDNGTSKVLNLENQDEKLDQGKKLKDFNHALPDEMQAAHSYPRHVPVHVLDGSQGTCVQTSRDTIFHPMGNVNGHLNPFTNAASSGTTEHQNNSPRSSVHQSIPNFQPPFTPFCHNQEDYQSYLHVSSAFSSLIVSTLLQNPAAHAAASFAASFWPNGTIRDSPACTPESFQSRQMNSTPSMAAIAGATVAAATAWWAAHGLLPVCAPLSTTFTCTPGSTTAVQSMEMDQVQLAKTEKKEDTVQNSSLQDQHLDPKCSEALQAQHSASKSLTASSSDSEESGGAKLSADLEVPDDGKAAAVTEVHDSDKLKNRNPVDRSSCGSNTASSSEVETDALEKHEKENEEQPKEADANLLAADSINRRIRSISNLNDSWKEVSEEGRLAFQALFRREVLPQSFSPPPPHDLKNREDQKNNTEENRGTQVKNEERNKDDKNMDTSLLDLNSKTWDSYSYHQEGEKTVSSTGDDNGEEGLLTMGLGQAKFKTRRTGFKPYKRCSVEARENRGPASNSQGEEKGPKRIRLDGEASM